MSGENESSNYPPSEGTPSQGPPKSEEKGFLTDGKPLRLSSTQIGESIDAIVLIPKGASEPAELAAQMRLSEVSAELVKTKAENEELKKAKAELEKSKAELEQKLQAIDDERRLSLATELIDLRIAKGLLSKDDKEAKVKELAKLGEEQLKTAVEDYKKLTGETKAKPKVQSGTEPQVTNPALAAEGETDEKRQKRMELFGHYETIEEVLKNNPDFAGQVERVEPQSSFIGGVA